MDVAALVPAAGRGERLGAAVPKALVQVLGESLLSRAVRGLLGSGCVHHVVVAAPAGAVGAVREAVGPLGSSVHVVAGGAERTHSVRIALAEAERLAPGVGALLVHDAARAFTPLSVIRAVVRSIEGGARAAVPVLPVSDTVKQVDDSGRVSATVDRTLLRTVQTPQGFAAEVLRDAYARSSDVATDDAGLVERAGYPVDTVPGHAHALKITTAFDLAIAESVLAASPDGVLAGGGDG